MTLPLSRRRPDSGCSAVAGVRCPGRVDPRSLRLPEVELVRHHGRVSADPIRSQLDRAERLRVILQRDGDRCLWCERTFSGLIEPTTDHLVPRVKGGPSWLENEVAACRRCNGQRGHRAPVEWLDECRRRGWTPNSAALEAALRRLRSAINDRGGQRRAARYLDAQLRRW